MDWETDWEIEVTHLGTDRGNVPEQVGDNNVDLATFGRNREHETSTRFFTPTKRRKINSLIAQEVRHLSVTKHSQFRCGCKWCWSTVENDGYLTGVRGNYTRCIRRADEAYCSRSPWA